MVIENEAPLFESILRRLTAKQIALLKEKARGNPWTIGGVGNAVYGGVWLRDVLDPRLRGVGES